jgi:hypothetical protein
MVTWSRLISACIRLAQGIYSFRNDKAQYHPKGKAAGSNKMSNNSSLAKQADIGPDTMAVPCDWCDESLKIQGSEVKVPETCRTVELGAQAALSPTSFGARSTCK